MSAIIDARTAANRENQPPQPPLQAQPAVPDETRIDVRPLAGRIGAEVRGQLLGPALDAGSFHALRQALLRYKVLFIRGQHQLDDNAHEAFARLFGPLIAHPTVPTVQGAASLMDIDSQHGGRANSWHTDMSFALAYPSVSILRGVVIPTYGGDTVWANTAAAFAHLPAALQALTQSLRAVHGNDYDYAGSRAPTDQHDAGALQYRKTFTAKVIETEHGVVQVHPQTGEKTLLVGHFAKRLVGQSAHDSAHLLGLLQNHITRLENTVRWRWMQGDVAIWDNRATQHYAINDYGDAHRVVRRVTVAGAAPLNADTLPSVTLTSGSVLQ